LSPLAKEVLFNKDLTEFIDSYDGRTVEPVTLPAKIPLLLLQGSDGIAVGMATKILPHNFCELLEAQKKILRNEDFVAIPTSSRRDSSMSPTTRTAMAGSAAGRKSKKSTTRTIVIRDIPYSTTTQSLTDSIERAAKAGKIKIVSINDYTAENVEIEIKLARGVYAKDTIKALYAFTDCEIPISPNLTLIRGNNPETSTVSDVLRYNTAKLQVDLTRELEIDLGRLQEKLHARLLEQIFIEERLYKDIEEETSYAAVIKSVEKSLVPFAGELVRAVTREDIEKLLEIRIKRISRYDINRQHKEIRDIRKEIASIEKSLKDTVGYTISYLDRLLEKYGPLYPRNTEIRAFSEVSVRKVAPANLLVSYNRESGFMGHQIKNEDEAQEQAIACSEYDRLLLLFSNGVYKVIPVTDKLFVGPELEWFGKVEKDLVFNVLYRDGQENIVYAKRFKTPSFILEKEYRIFPEHKRSKILLLTFGEGRSAHVSLMPSSRAKSNVLNVLFDDYLVKNPSPRERGYQTELSGRLSKGRLICGSMQRKGRCPHCPDSSSSHPRTVTRRTMGRWPTAMGRISSDSL